LRNYPNIDKKVQGVYCHQYVYDDETTKLLKFVGREDITKLNVIYVLSRWCNQGVLKQESLTVWISDDNNRLPIHKSGFGQGQ
jgi:hypothetical protein